MSETWVFNTKDSDACIDFAAKGISEGWLVSVYRVDKDERIRSDMNPKERPYKLSTWDTDLFDQDG